MDTALPPRRLSNLPLWRLLVALDDAERTVGPDSSTARALARVVRERLKQEPHTNDCLEVAHGSR